MQRKAMLAVLLACGAQSAWAADADSKAQFSVGVKVWNSSWFSYNPGVYTGVTPGGTPALADSVDAVEGARKTDMIPVLSVRKGKYGLSLTHAAYASDFFSAHSSVVGPNGMNIITTRSDHLSRKETDLTGAYFILPNIALSMALKHASEARDSTTGVSATQRFIDTKGKAVIFGAAANFPIANGLSAYGQLGAGPARLDAHVHDGSPDKAIHGRYLSNELGVSYALRMADPYVKGVFVGLGYRSQTIATSGVGPAYLDGRKYRDTKDGIVFSLTVAL